MVGCSKIEDRITALVEDILAQFQELCLKEIPPILVEVPKERSHGDLSTNIAMRLSARLKRSPIDLANRIAALFREKMANSELAQKIGQVKAEPPGFINFFLTAQASCGVLLEIHKEKSSFGRSGAGKGKKLLIEFVSSNPTGPLTLAHARQAAVGDALANILEFSGYKVEREYYVNDEGNQITILGRSIRARYLELLGIKSEFPQDGYQGAYIYEIARALIDKYQDKPANEKYGEDFFSKDGVERILHGMKNDLQDFGVKFDNWSYQSKMQERINETLAILKNKGYLYENEGAVWFKSSAFGDEKDRVVRKSDGTLTYLSPDMAYHRDKYERNFDVLIDIFGPDHHGYIPRLMAAVCALGYERSSLNVLIVQLATLYRGKEKLQMSTRRGEFVTLRQLLDEVGRDASRFFLLSRKISAHLDFDLELAKKHSPENPVYYIQYAHARICSILQLKDERKIRIGRAADLELLKEKEEVELMGVLREFPGVVEGCALSFEPYGMGAYLLKLASAFHYFYTKHRVICDGEPLTQARLFLVECTKTVLAKGLELLGVSRPEKM